MANHTRILFFASISGVIILFSNCRDKIPTEDYVVTVTGEMEADKIGKTLSHEHITTDFIGAEKVKQPQYLQKDAIDIILPYLMELKNSGIETIFECTPAYIGRDPLLLKALSELSGINIITNTGYYAAVDKKYLPKHAFKENEEQIAARWEKEWIEGIENTEIRPGFIKLGVGFGPLDSIESKLLNAAIILHKKSGLSIAIHTGDEEAALSEYEIITNAGINTSKMIWVHAQNGTDQVRIDLAKMGVWVSLDGVSESKISNYTRSALKMKENKLLNKLLISHDDGWSIENRNGKINLEPFKNGNSKPYYTIMNQFIDSLKIKGFTQTELDAILIENPKKAFAISKQ